MALKQANWRQAEVVGYSRHHKTGSLALKLGAVDRIESDLSETVKGADIVIIATPVLTIKDIFSQIAPSLSSNSIVTDTASTKLQVMRWAEELLLPGIDFVGGHPMAGKELSGISAATVNLFRNCTYCITPTLRTKQAAVRTVKEMVKQLGAIPLTINAQEHDSLVAGVSHLPLLLSVALVSATTKHPSWQRMSRIAAGGYRDLTRLASGNPEVNAHICLTNQAAIASWIDVFTEELQRLRKLVAEGGNEIEKALALANEARQKWLKRR